MCCLVSPVAWIRSLSPTVPGMAGRLLALPLALMELVGTMAECFALMVRLFANMLSGHALLAILLLFVVMTLRSFLETQALRELFYVGPAVVAFSLAIDLLELLVAVLQAYIFTFLSALFLGLYAQPAVRESARAEAARLAACTRRAAFVESVRAAGWALVQDQALYGAARPLG